MTEFDIIIPPRNIYETDSEYSRKYITKIVAGNNHHVKTGGSGYNNYVVVPLNIYEKILLSNGFAISSYEDIGYGLFSAGIIMGITIIVDPKIKGMSVKYFSRKNELEGSYKKQNRNNKLDELIGGDI